jgi:hypothetical protein|nr:MAG TPA: leucine rich repeat protein [Caudoviricetes sp.]
MKPSKFFCSGMAIIFLIFSLIGLSSCAHKQDDEKQWSVGLSYTISEDGKHYIVDGLGDCVDPNVYIPPIYNGLPVTELSGFNYIDTRFRLYLPNSITKINDGSFYESSGLVALNFGNSVKNIGFETCNFGSVPSIYYEGTLEEWCEIDIENVHFGSNIHIQNELVTELIIPKTISTVKRGTFYSFTNVTKIIIPTNVLNIEEYAFSNCLSVEEFYFEDITSIWQFNLYQQTINFTAKELNNGVAYKYLIGGSGPKNTGYPCSKLS